MLSIVILIESTNSKGRTDKAYGDCAAGAVVELLLLASEPDKRANNAKHVA